MSLKIKCPTCSGLGSHKEKARDLKSGKDKERFRTCKRCKGTGFITKKGRWDPR